MFDEYQTDYLVTYPCNKYSVCVMKEVLIAEIVRLACIAIPGARLRSRKREMLTTACSAICLTNCSRKN